MLIVMYDLHYTPRPVDTMWRQQGSTIHSNKHTQLVAPLSPKACLFDHFTAKRTCPVSLAGMCGQQPLRHNLIRPSPKVMFKNTHRVTTHSMEAACTTCNPRTSHVKTLSHKSPYTQTPHKCPHRVSACLFTRACTIISTACASGSRICRHSKSMAACLPPGGI